METGPRMPLTGARVLSGLRMSLHLAVALLLAVGTARMYVDEGSLWPGLAPVGLFVLLYAAGTVTEGRMRRTDTPVPAAARLGWLFAVTAVWGLLVLHHPDFAWLAFPLFFLHIHLLPLIWGLTAVVAITAVVVFALGHGADGVQVATVLGPSIGAVCAVVMALAYRTLRAENRAQQEALDELRRTREDLARTQREAGALAERERMARDIHDTLAQGFSSIVLMTRAAESDLVSGDSEAASERLDTVRRTAGENLDQARRLVRALQSEAAEDEPLLHGLRELCTRTERRAAAEGARLSVRLDVQGSPRVLGASASLALLRAAQSSLANVTQHARAGTAVITLSFLDDEVTLDVFDDGVGFDPHSARVADSAPVPAAEDGSGFGLQALAQRAEALGGTAEVESAPGEGTVVALRLPTPVDEGAPHV